MGWDPFQLLINVSTRSVASHVAIGLGDHLLHAYEPGIIFEPRAAYFQKRDQRLVAEFEILPDVSDGILTAAENVGQRGFLRGAAQIIATRALRIAGSPLCWFVPSTERTCAQFAMSIDRAGIIPEWREIDRRAVVPADLLDVARIGPSFAQVC